MEQSSQRLPSPMNVTQETTNQNTSGAVDPIVSAQAAEVGGGSQPSNQPTVGNVAVGANPSSLPPQTGKKRKHNASGPRKTSTAWDHFVKLPENEVEFPTAACKYCGKRYLCDPKTHGTSNMLAHFKICPKYTHAINQDPNQTVLTFAPGTTDLVASSTKFNVEACRKALATFIIVDEQAFRVVEGEGFKHFCRTLQPQFTIPSRFTAPRDCFRLYMEEKVKLNAFLRSECSRVALTTDCWTYIQNLHYLTLTAHFIDNDWKYQKRIISFCVVPNHKGDTISRQVEEILRKWGLKNLSTITMDNATSNDVAAGLLRRRFKIMNGLVLDGEFFHVRCCAHILNLVVSDGLKDMDSSISKIRHAVRFVRSSPQRLQKFKDCIEFSRIPSSKLVCLDVPTRWNSTYLMLEAAEKFQLAFEKLEYEDVSFSEHFGTVGTPNCMDWETARTFMKFLKIFYDATNIFSVSLNVSIHTVFHQLASIYMELKNCIEDTNSVLSNMGREMKKKYDKYWGNMLNLNQLIYIGFILDPRYKFAYIEWSFNDMYKSERNFANELTASIIKNLHRLYDWYASVYEQQNRGSQTSRDPSMGSSNVDNAGYVENTTNLARADAFQKHLEEKNSIDQKNELERYLYEPNVKRDDKWDFLLWWKQHSSRFPILSTMAKEVLATPISTVAFESAFSTGGRVLDSFRSNLKPEMAEALICSQNWLKPSLYQLNDFNFMEMFETSEAIVTEFSQCNLGGVERSTSGAATKSGPATSSGAATTSGATGFASSSQSQPNIGCD